MHDQRDVAASGTSISALSVTTCEAMEIKQGQDRGESAQAL
jgi:hypothetical protein